MSVCDYEIVFTIGQLREELQRLPIYVCCVLFLPRKARAATLGVQQTAVQGVQIEYNTTLSSFSSLNTIAAATRQL